MIVGGVKRLFVIALAVLVAGCDTMGYPDDPYGSPTYPPDSYPPYPPGQGYPPPGAPYPPDAPSPPGGYYPQPGPPGAPACDIAGSREWSASVGTMPGNPQPTLYVSGKVLASSGGYTIAFDPDLQIAESYPAQAFATLRVTPPAGPAAQVVMTHNVRWQWPLRQPIGRVVVRCGDKTLADMAPAQTPR